MWHLLLIVVARAAAQELTGEYTRRFVDIFGEPLDEPGDPAEPVNPGAGDGNGTDCICLPYSRCRVSRVTSDAAYWSDDLKSRHMSCANVFDWCCEPGRLRPARSPRVGCGWSAARAPGASSAGFSEFPWLVAVLEKSSGKTWSPRQLVATGAIIHQSAVLTAAHRVFGRDHHEIKCRAGEWNASSSAEQFPHQDRAASEIVVHESYYRPQMANNIALIILATPFDLTRFPHVGLACVAAAVPPAGTVCYGTGWGRLAFGDQAAYAQVPKKIELPLVDQAVCETQLRSSRLGVGFNLHSSLLCAGGGGADTCTGDGGAPLVCPIGTSGQRYGVAGVTAWGVGCGARPAAYARAPPLRAWAARALAAHGIHTDLSYQE